MERALEQPFYISSKGPPSRPRKTLKHNDSFAVFDSHGDIGAVAGGPDGLFDSDTRFLSYFELFVNDLQPLLLGSTIRDDNLHMYVDLTNPDIRVEGEIVLPKDTVHISRTMFLRDGVMHERVAVENHSGTMASLKVTVAYDSDFADIFEVRGMRRARRGKSGNRVLTDSDVTLSYLGLDGVLRETAIAFEPAPTVLDEKTATFHLQLPAGAQYIIFVCVSCRGRTEAPLAPFFKGLRLAHRARKLSMRNVASIETSSSVINEILCRSIADFYMLVSQTEQGPFPYAGIPWFATSFGRDGIIAAMEVLAIDPSIARGVLKRLAAFQAKEIDGSRDSQPGKILHEMRGGEMAALREVPFGLYYGSVDSTPLFVMLAGLYAERTGDYPFILEIWPHIENALAWIDRYGDRDGDGFIEYQRARETGLSNQGWKDSFDSIFHADGRLAEGPIALVEVQAYTFAAKRLAGHCARHLGFSSRAAELSDQAEKLRVRFEEAFWVEELGTYALALDGSKKQCRVRSSNAFHALAGGIASPGRAAKLAAQLSGSDFSCGWGVRTIAQGEARYNPMSYHNGSVWPHDNALIAMGLAKYGLQRGIEPIFAGLCRAATWMDQRRLPELYCGFRSKRGRGPTLYPVACAPQAWASGAPFMILQAMLGLEFDPAAREVRLRDPVVPEYLGELTIRGLQLGDARVDFAVHRIGTATSLRVLRNDGAIRVSLVMDPGRQSFNAE